jgi:hypothetical protein
VVDLVELTFLKMLYNLAASSAFIPMAVNPVKVQRASLDVVRKAFVFYVYEALYCCIALPVTQSISTSRTSEAVELFLYMWYTELRG